MFKTQLNTHYTYVIFNYSHSLSHQCCELIIINLTVAITCNCLYFVHNTVHL